MVLVHQSTWMGAGLTRKSVVCGNQQSPIMSLSRLSITADLEAEFLNQQRVAQQHQ